MADIKLNAGESNSLSKKDQDQITEIMRTTGLLDQHSAIVADPSVAAALAAKGVVKPAGIFCKIACDIGEAAAVAACATLSGPAAGICIAAAHVAGDICRSKC